MSTIAFIGLGNMGGGMAGNLVKAGHEVRAFDLMPEATRQNARLVFTDFAGSSTASLATPTNPLDRAAVGNAKMGRR